MPVYKSVLELVGKTPLIELVNYQRKNALKAKIFAKIESFNPGGSIKDRVALAMIEEAEMSGKLTKGGTIIEPTSGNTGIGLAMVAAVKGYNLIVTMPKSMSVERVKLLRLLGAEVVLTEGGMRSAIKKAKELAADIKNAFIPFQFENAANPQIHFRTTAKEIWQDTGGNIDYFVAGVGTGGTVTGVGGYLKSKNPNIKVVAVEPENSPVLSGGKAGAHKIQGIGAGFVPKTLDTGIYDEVITVSDQEAFTACRELSRTEGILAGISSGAAVCAAAKLALREENAGKTIVTILPDTGERYLSTELFEEYQNYI